MNSIVKISFQKNIISMTLSIGIYPWLVAETWPIKASLFQSSQKQIFDIFFKFIYLDATKSCMLAS